MKTFIFGNLLLILFKKLLTARIENLYIWVWFQQNPLMN